MLIRVNYFLFGSVFFLKSNQINFFKKKTETEPKPVQIDRFRFGSVFLEQKQVKTGFARFFSGLARFFGLAWLFSGLARFFFRFFRFGFGFLVSGL